MLWLVLAEVKPEKFETVRRMLATISYNFLMLITAVFDLFYL